MGENTQESSLVIYEEAGSLRNGTMHNEVTYLRNNAQGGQGTYLRNNAQGGDLFKEQYAQGENSVQIRITLAFAHLCSDNNRKSIFIDNNRLELLPDLLESTSLKQRCGAAVALYKLATKTTSSPLVDAAPSSPTLQVYLGEQYVNNLSSSFLVLPLCL
ncbi:hypothetical protein TanjilG_15546 [Lupinus angustifolius]|nr:hypothetical protein TanjilG_15546 [Lupinus angustifolius]